MRRSLDASTTSSPARSLPNADFFANVANVANLAKCRQFAPLSVASSSPILLLPKQMTLWFWLLGRIPCLRRRVYVNFVHDEGTAIEGVLFAQRGAWLVLKDARLLSKTAPAVAMDGDVVIECAKVSFIQVVGS